MTRSDEKQIWSLALLGGLLVTAALFAFDTAPPAPAALWTRQDAVKAVVAGDKLMIPLEITAVDDQNEIRISVQGEGLRSLVTATPNLLTDVVDGASYPIALTIAPSVTSSPGFIAGSVVVAGADGSTDSRATLDVVVDVLWPTFHAAGLVLKYPPTHSVSVLPSRQLSGVSSSTRVLRVDPISVESSTSSLLLSIAPAGDWQGPAIDLRHVEGSPNQDRSSRMLSVGGKAVLRRESIGPGGRQDIYVHKEGDRFVEVFFESRQGAPARRMAEAIIAQMSIDD